MAFEASLGALAVAGLVLLPATATAGPEGKTERGTIGASIEYERYVEECVGGPERSGGGKRQPFAGTMYAGTRWRDVRQGQAVYRWSERSLYLIHDFFCTTSAVGATLPWSCEATAFIVRAGPPLQEHGGRLADDLVGKLDGDFGDVEPHPTLPIFLAVRYGWGEKGWSDEEALVSVHDLSGGTLCPKTALVVVGGTGQDIWASVKVDGARLVCPGGRRVSIPAWPGESARP